ncbi:MAG: translation initiation factor IF-2 N-terminal domain-containing protein, partial [Acidobacteria bacterium]|nr:translation initiation factor IF-2 N-terminal domain-containing protein [Acidobacteriota bacterium]
MSTVRIYKVAELLNTTSQEVLQLLKQNHGIELKSASSTLEEIVARQFVDRLSRQRGIELPKGDVFSESAVKPVNKKSGAPTLKKAGVTAEPAKPAAPVLPPPRLIKTMRPPTAPAVEQTDEPSSALVLGAEDDVAPDEA